MKISQFIKFALPLGIWGFLFNPFLLGQATIGSETYYIYSVVKFYTDNISHGVFPMWNPYVMWGTPMQIYLNYIGIYNPLWALPGILSLCGLSFYHSFILSLTIYFGLGQIGFYCLAKLLIKDERAAYIAFLFFLFSSVSLSLFVQYHPPLTYIPSIWFFYFLISFVQNPRRSAWIGLTLTLAVILTSYLPFYFLTVLLIVGTLSFILYFQTIKSAWPRIGLFVRNNKGLLGLSFAVTILAMIPGFEAYQSTVNKEIVAPFRNESIEKKAGVEISNYAKVSVNSLAGRMAPQDLYSGLDAIQYGDDCFFYIPIFFYIILIAGAFVRFNKMIMVCAITALILFFLMITDASSFHRFIFDHVFYFHLIRNMHFFLPFFICIMILMAGEIFRLIFQNKDIVSKKYRRLAVLGILAVHLGLAFFLLQQEYIIISSYLALVISLLFWLYFIFNRKEFGKTALPALLFLSIMVQPIEVFWHHIHSPFHPLVVSDYDLIRSSVKTPTVNAKFTYQRPVSDKEFNNNDFAHCLVTMTDASQFYPSGFPTYWSFFLMQRVPPDVLQNYTKNKFYLYDNVRMESNPAADIKNLTVMLKENLNLALVSSEHSDSRLAEFMGQGKKSKASRALAVIGPSDQFAVLSFDVNSITLRVKNEGMKFLIYTDSFHKNWEASVNGHAVPVYRANMAFRGIILPSGINEIEFKFKNNKFLGMSLLLHLTLISLLIFLFWTIANERCKNKILA